MNLGRTMTNRDNATPRRHSASHTESCAHQAIAAPRRVCQARRAACCGPTAGPSAACTRSWHSTRRCMRPAAFGSQKLSTVLLTMRAAQSSLFAAESFRCGCDRQVRVAGATRDHPAALLARLSAPTHLPCTHVAISISIVFVSFRLCAAPMAAATRHLQHCDANLCSAAP